ncbi:MAG: PEP/pyruvate-binding domain-containing protein [bacterium]
MTTSAVRSPLEHASNAAAFGMPLHVETPLEKIGGKAHTLGRLMRAGVRVPPGFVLTTEALEAHLAEAQLGERIASAPDAATIRSLVMEAPLPDALRDELFARAESLLTKGPVVVRSSAVGEDSDAASFAGQLDSVLHVRDEAMLEHAVLTCWASFWSDRAVFYRSARGMVAGGMGVIVQQQVDACAAGVMFTDDGGSALLAEYTSGLGDALVSGAIDPARIRIDRVTSAVQQEGERIPDADVVVMAPTGIASLLDAALKLERVLGAPQDVEWAMTADGTLFIVQSRPITAALHGADESRRTGELQTNRGDSARQIVWSNANVNENFPTPISPLLYSVASAGYTHYFRNIARALGISRRRIAAMEPAFARIIGVHGARMYYNLTNIHAVIRLAPFGDALASSFDAFVGATGEAPSTGNPVGSRSRFRQAMEVGVIAARTTWQYLFIEGRIRRFESRADEFAARAHPSRLSSLSIAELRGLIAEFMAIRCHGWKDASLADAAAMVCYGALQRLIAHTLPGGNEAAHTSLLKAIPRVVSNEPVHRLWALSRLVRANEALAQLIEHEDPALALDVIERDERFVEFRKAFNAYLDEWGFRCSSELMLTTPSFQEEPAPVIALLRSYARLDAESPVEAMARQSAEREQETSRAMMALSSQRLPYVPWMTWAAVLRVLLPWTHGAIRYRERARLKQALLYGRLRRVALAMGDLLVSRGMLDKRDDIFWMTVSELDELASGGAMFAASTRELVALRSRVHGTLSESTPPDSFTLPEGAYLSNDTARQAGPSAAALPQDSNQRLDLKGTTACTGRVKGRASVLRDVTESERLGKGDILVTKQTDPGWGPVFFLISGLVIERGGMLSHGAILAREFGIPCVVGVRDATRVIPDGATVTVDADKGWVHVER